MYYIPTLKTNNTNQDSRSMKKIGVTRKTHDLLLKTVQNNYDELAAIHEEIRKAGSDTSVRVNHHATELERERSLQIILYHNKQKLKRSIVVPRPKSKKFIQLGSQVKINFAGKILEFIVDGMSLSKDICSLSSPLGRVLAGKKAGDALVFNEQKVEILAIT